MFESRSLRVLLAALGQLWAYWSALDRGDWTAATIVLTSYQRGWSAVRTELVANAGSARTAIENNAPMALAPNGQWDSASRDSAVYLIAVALGADTLRAVGTIPANAGALAAWWRGSLVPRFPRSSEIGAALWAFDDDVRADDSVNAGLSVDAHSREVIDNIVIGPATFTNTGSSTASSVAAAATSSTTSVQQRAAASSGASIITSANEDRFTQLPATTITGRAQRWSAWQYFVVGLGFVTFGGLATLLWRVMQAKPRRRRA